MTTQADDEMQNEPLLNPDLLVKIYVPRHRYILYKFFINL